MTLLDRLKNHDDASAWSEFADIYGATIYGWAKRMGLQDADAEDLTQETFRCVVRSLHTYDRTRGRFRGWLHAIARNEMLKLRERLQKNPSGSGDTGVHQRLAEEAGDERTAWSEAWSTSLVRAALSRLRGRVSEKNWLAFWKSEMEGESAGSIARQLEVSVGSIYVARCRVLSQLREVVNELLREEEEGLR